DPPVRPLVSTPFDPEFSVNFPLETSCQRAEIASNQLPRNHIPFTATGPPRDIRQALPYFSESAGAEFLKSIPFCGITSLTASTSPPSPDLPPAPPHVDRCDRWKENS